jgi:hypothetical protein
VSPPAEAPATPYVSAYLDPRIYLRAPKASAPHLDICDFVNLSAPVRIEVTESSDAMSLFDQIMKAKSGPKKPRLEDVSVAEWGMANQRIMAELYDPPTAEAEYYWAYTLKVFEMFTKFDRVRVLEYDRAYRVKQAASGFLWGTDLPHCNAMTVGAPGMGTSRQSGHGQFNAMGNKKTWRGGDSGSRPPICAMYNQPSGCKFGQKCNFLHICKSCESKHPAFTHASPSNTQGVIHSSGSAAAQQQGGSGGYAGQRTQATTHGSFGGAGNPPAGAAFPSRH